MSLCEICISGMNCTIMHVYVYSHLTIAAKINYAGPAGCIL